uniref:Uncharacterized protein n=1 Tax=Ciona savignyi TaxID=51511 RepID=H2YCS3_CIOSA
LLYIFIFLIPPNVKYQWHLDGIVSSSFDGQLKYFSISPQNGGIENGIILKEAFSLSEENGLNLGRQILCSASWNRKLVYGDDGSNLKIVEPETGAITRHPNHKSSGFTNSILLHKDLMLSTCYEL